MYDDFLQSIDLSLLMQHVQNLTRISPERLSGTEEERRTVDYICGFLEDNGIPVEIHEFDAFISFPGKSKIEILSPEKRNIPCSTFAQIAATNDEGIEAELVYVGQGAEIDYEGKDIKGKIALAELSYTPPRPEKVRIAMGKGAVGMIMMNWGLPDHDSLPMGTVKPIWGNPTDQDFHLLPTIPVLGITRRDGESLTVESRKGSVRIRMQAKSSRNWATIRLPQIRIPGNAGKGKFVLVGGHYDAWGGGVTCNATGNAIKLEYARIFWKMRDQLYHDVMICLWPGHETGMMSGSTWMVDTFWKDITRNCLIYINIDSPGLKEASEIMVRTSPEIARFHWETVKMFKEIVGNTPIQRQRLTRVGDQSFFGVGVPSLYARHSPSAEEMKRWHGATLGWWYHSDQDTIDKIDQNHFLMDARINMCYVLRLACSRLMPFEFVTLTEEFIKRLEELQQQAKDLFDLSNEIRRAKECREKMLKLDHMVQEMTRSELATNHNNVDILNDCLMRLSRILTPAFSTIGGRYGQDTYGQSALNHPIPGLYELKKLAGINAASDFHKLLRTRLVREQNKVFDSLDNACWLVDMYLNLYSLGGTR